MPPAAKARGEIAELGQSLQSLLTAGKRSDKELKQAKRDVFKKIILVGVVRERGDVGARLVDRS